MSDFVESLKRLYAANMLKLDQLRNLFSKGKISKEELEYIQREEKKK